MTSSFHKNDFKLPGNSTEDSIILDAVQLPVKNHLSLDVSSDDLRVNCVNLEYGVWGMEFNSKFGFYKQEWHLQAYLVCSLKPGIQS